MTNQEPTADAKTVARDIVIAWAENRRIPGNAISLYGPQLIELIAAALAAKDAEIAALELNLDAERVGIASLRIRLGAVPSETIGQAVDRIVDERDNLKVILMEAHTVLHFCMERLQANQPPRGGVTELAVASAEKWLSKPEVAALLRDGSSPP